MPRNPKNDLLPKMTPRPVREKAAPATPQVAPEPEAPAEAIEEAPMPKCSWCGDALEPDYGNLCDGCLENSVEFVNACVAAKSMEDVQQAFTTWSSRRGTEGTAALTQCVKCEKLVWNDTWPQPDKVYCQPCAMESW